MAVTFNDKIWNRKPTQFPGNYRIHTLTINGEDISDHFIQLDLYEELFSPMTGKLVIGDTKNLILNIPIIGEEELHIIADDEVQRIDLKFKIYKITDRQQLRYGLMKYVLHFISDEGYRDSFTKVSQSWDRAKYEDTVDYILTNYLQSKKKLLKGGTLDKQCFIIPYWSPFEAISWLAGRSIPDDNNYGNGTFVWFENLNGFNFLALENLYDSSKNKPFAKITFDPLRPTKEGKGVYDARIPSDVMRLESYNVIESFDILDASKEGMYANRIYLTDTTTKGTAEIDYHYIKNFYDGQHLGGGLQKYGNPICTTKHIPIDFPEANLNAFVEQKGNFTNEPDGGSHLEEWAGRRISQDRQMENFIIEGMLPGQLELVVGMQFEFDFPNIKDRASDQNPAPDIWYSGNYLVSTVRRTFTKDKLWISVQMFKESVSFNREGGIES